MNGSRFAGVLRARVRLLAFALVVAAASIAAGVIATTASALPPCGFDCTTPYYTPYPFGTWDGPTGSNGGATPYDGSDDTTIYTGYAIDWDSPSDPDGGYSDPIYVRADVYRWNQHVSPWSLEFDRSYVVLADQPRAGLPLSITRYLGNRHGFSVEIPDWNLARPVGAQWIGRVCFTGLNVGPGADRPLLRTIGTTTTNCWTNLPLS